MSAIVNQPATDTPPAPAAGARSDAIDVDDRPLPADTRNPIRLGFWVLVVGFGGFLAWAALAPLDEGVSAQGAVAIETRRRMIQHQTGGVVKKVLVKEGQAVRAGDVLIELEEANAKATYAVMRQNYLAQRAAESRALAEQAGSRTIRFHPDLIAGAGDPVVRQHMAAQTRLFDARRQALEAELSGLRAAITGLEAQITGYASMIDNRKVQADLQAEQLRRIRELAAEGYAPRNQVLQLEQGQAELRATLADLQANRQRAQQSIEEMKTRIAQRRQEYQKEAGAQLADVRRDVQASHERMHAASEELNRIWIKSPVLGQVVGLTVSSIGGVVTPGQKLMDIVPQGEELLIDAKIPPHVIDRVRVGDETDVRFNAFSHSPQLVLQAKLVSLSKDVISEQVGGQIVTYYLGRVEVTPEGLKKLGNRVMQPGMPAEVLVKTGERSMLTYLLQPLTKRVAASLKEE